MGIYVADFETTTDVNDCRVWGYAVCNIDDLEDVSTGTTLDRFMSWCNNPLENNVVYFHNLKFDSQFIIYWLFKNGFTHVTDGADRGDKTFTTLISDKGLYYEVEVVFKKRGKKVIKVTFLDSLKLIPLSVDSIAKTFKLPFQKLEIDYSRHNKLPIGYPLSKEEKDYIINDVKIVAYAVKYFKDQGLNKMTIGSCALDEYKKLLSKRAFKRYYPPPTYHDDVKPSYRGGFTWLNPKFKDEIIGEGIVLDVNSLYPSVMFYDLLPFGKPIYFKGKYKDDPIYPLYTQMIMCQFKLKPGKIPTIQYKYGNGFASNEYLESSGDKELALCLNSVDLKLFLEHYDVYNLEYISGWKFKASYGLFNKYIDKWSSNKIKAKKEGNHGLYLISKLFLNSLYGKFGTDTKITSKIPYLSDIDGQVHYMDVKEADREGVYIAMASFITSYARLKTISSAQKIMDDYNDGLSNIQIVYCDTDSLHCLSKGHELPKGLHIDDTLLGAWKYESKFTKAKFLRQKCYIEQSTEDIENEHPEYKLKVTVAGMPSACHDQVTFSNFKLGASYSGKIQPKNVEGGVVLQEVDFTIKDI